MALSKDPQKRAKQLANLEKGKFKKGDIGNPNGRPVSLWGAFCRKCEELGATTPINNAEAFNALLLAFGLTRAQLKKLVNDEDLAMFERIAAREVLSNKSREWLITLLKGLYGDKMDITSKGEKIENKPWVVQVIDSRSQIIKTDTDNA